MSSRVDIDQKPRDKTSTFQKRREAFPHDTKVSLFLSPSSGAVRQLLSLSFPRPLPLLPLLLLLLQQVHEKFSFSRTIDFVLTTLAKSG